MKQEEKELLLADLCARLTYRPNGVKLNALFGPEDITVIGYTGRFVETIEDEIEVENVRLYLRPMSSMTEEEFELLKQYSGLEYDQLDLAEFPNNHKCLDFYLSEVPSYAAILVFDWLNAHHFDYRLLIEMGLALEAPEGMYNKEKSEKGDEIPVPKTVDEAVKTLAKILSDEDRDYLLENGAISMHDSLGRWIRNEWGLWTGSELKDELMNMNKGLNHPDDMSNYIIEEFIKYWNDKTRA